MTIEALNEAIKRLILKRQNTPQTDFAEIDRIGQKLTKLYDIKYIYYLQIQEKEARQNANWLWKNDWKNIAKFTH